ncbi:T9SS type A sorting domain-containing protein [Epilithonimonas sp.]|uniref:T9SS type A sorting domain-containing protein n=1 Tax=Epilithonimonas sp. TaxID=2894511 RepID=UPI00289AF167|nr:T9SS type A sorting domain-containing protein [Epilithonimonas sp.]
MKALRLFFNFLFISCLVNAQQYRTIAIQSGFNADVIANGVGNANTVITNDMDGGGYALVSKDYQQTSASTPAVYGLPETGLIHSVASPGLNYQLASYSGNNSIDASNQWKNIKSVTISRTPTGSSVAHVFAFSAYQKSEIAPDSNGRVYVNANVDGGTESGNSWTNAVKNLVDVFSAVKTNNDIKEIWVAKGTYYPSLTSNRDDFLQITRNNFKVYGGFAGTETALSQRNIEENETILSGDIGTQDSATDNSYHIMIIDAETADIDNSTQIDGFTFQDANASLGSVYNNYAPRYSGSAILIYPSEFNNSPTISNNIFRNNSQFQTGAIEVDSNNTGSNFTKIENCSFINNYAKYAGGGISVFNYNTGSPQNVQVIGCIFESNSVDNASQGGTTGGVGGAVFVYGGGEVLINRSKFINNIIGTYTQYLGTYKGTAIAAGSASKVTLVNSLIYSDQIYIPLFNSSSTFNIINSTVYNPDGGTILSTVSPILNSIQNSIFWMGGDSVNAIDGSGTSVTANNSIILPKHNVMLNGSNNYTTDPLFNNISANDFTLKSSSNGINRGNNSFYDVSKYGNYDVADKSRIEQTTIDIGAFENQPTLLASDINKAEYIIIFPNPVKDILNFHSDEKILKIEIISIDGRKIIEKNMNDEKKLNVQTLQRGLYLINIFTEKEIRTIRFIKD